MPAACRLSQAALISPSLLCGFPRKSAWRTVPFIWPAISMSARCAFGCTSFLFLWLHGRETSITIKDSSWSHSIVSLNLPHVALTNLCIYGWTGSYNGVKKVTCINNMNCILRHISWPQNAEIKVLSAENTELKGSPFKAWSRSVYSHTCYANCQWFLPC